MGGPRTSICHDEPADQRRKRRGAYKPRPAGEQCSGGQCDGNVACTPVGELASGAGRRAGGRAGGPHLAFAAAASWQSIGRLAAFRSSLPVVQFPFVVP